MRIIGIDPSLTSTGIAAIDTTRQHPAAVTSRIESTPPKRAKGDKTPATITERRQRIRSILDKLRDWATPHTSLTVIEGPSYASAGASTWDRAWLWGGVVDMLLSRDIPVVLVPPRTRALWATGSGAAGKSPIAVHLSRMWPDLDPGISDDEWDALALASMGAQHLGLLPVELARHREQLAKIVWPDFPEGAAA